MLILAAVTSSTAAALSRSSVATPGEWTSNVADARRKADPSASAPRVPIVLLSVGSSCGYCQSLESALDTVAVRNWMKSRGYYFVLGVDNDDVRAFIQKSYYGTKLPLCKVVWKRKTSTGDSYEVDRGWAGRNGEMPVTSGSLAEQFMATVDFYVGAYAGGAGDYVNVTPVADPSNGGSVKGGGMVEKGKSLTLTATPKYGYMFFGWYDATGALLSKSQDLAYVPQVQNETLTARFVRKADDVVSVSCALAGQYETHVSKVSVPVSVTTASEIVDLKAFGLPDGLTLDKGVRAIVGTPTKSGTYSVEIQAKNASGSIGTTGPMQIVVASADEHRLSVVCLPGMGTVGGSGIYAEGQRVTVKATPASGWIFSRWDQGGETVSRAASFAYLMPANDAELEAKFISKSDDADSIALSFDGRSVPLSGFVECKATEGIRTEWSLEPSALSAATVAVRGLPAGLSLVKTAHDDGTYAYAVAGVPTTASRKDAQTGLLVPTVMEVKVTTAGRNEKIFTVLCAVDEAPTSTIVVKIAAECAEMGRVTEVSKSLKAGSKVALKAVANKGYAFVCWENADGEVIATTASYPYVASGLDDTLTARFVAAADDGLEIDAADCKTVSPDPFDGEVPFSVRSGSEVKIEVKNLPPGVSCRFESDGETTSVVCFGKVTKAGEYWPSCRAKNGNGYQSSAICRWTVGSPAETDFDDIGLALDDWNNLATGRRFSWAVDTQPVLVKLTASGLPAGLKLTAASPSGWTVTGTPTAAGKYAVKFTATLPDRKTARALKTVVVRNAGSAFLRVACGEGQEDRGETKGGGVMAVGAVAKLSAKAAKGFYFAGWHADPACEVPLVMGSGDWRKASDSYQTSEDDWPEAYARFVSKDEDAAINVGFLGDEIQRGEDGETWKVAAVWDEARLNYGECFFEVISETYPTVSVSGLPSGCTWDKSRNALLFKKQPAKPGLSTVTLKAKNVSGATIQRTLLVQVPNLRSDVFTGLDYDGVCHVTRGVASEPCLSGFTVQEGWKVTASGLPSGLKLLFDANTSAGCISGLPTKAGSYTVFLTAKKGSSSEKASVTFVVDELPQFAVGSFSGDLYEFDGPVGSISLTAAASGKLSVKIVTAYGDAKTYSASAWSGKLSDTGGYYADLTKAVAGREPEVIRLEVRDDEWTGLHLTGGCEGLYSAKGGRALADGTEIRAQRNPFGKVGRDFENADAHEFARSLEARGSLPGYLTAEGDGYLISGVETGVPGRKADLGFKVAASGKVTLSGKIAGKSVSSSCTLRCDGTCGFARFYLSVGVMTVKFDPVEPSAVSGSVEPVDDTH